MRYLIWILRLAIFIVILLFALKNTDPVNVRFFADNVITGVPLIVVMLTVFVLGVLLGWAIAAPAMMRRRREIARLKRDLARIEDAVRHPVVHSQPAAPETVAPLAPL